MKELLSFFKDIFMMSEENSTIKVGLSQFKEETVVEKPAKKVEQKEIKLSDLMRRSA